MAGRKERSMAGRGGGRAERAERAARAEGRRTGARSGARTLHLGRSAEELALFEFQHAAICFMEAFHRHLEGQLIRLTGDPRMSAQDCVILHAIRLGERSKSIPDIQHFTNRTDIANIQYSVKKLVKAGLVRTESGGAGRGTRYELTAEGMALTDEYIRARQALMAKVPIDAERLMRELKVATQVTLLLTGLYDHVSRTEAAL
jgi:predicted MarR family transcription regulator